MPAAGLRLGLLAAAALHRAAALQEDLEIWAVGGYSFEPLVGFGFDVGGSYDVQLELTSVGGTGSTCTGVGAGRSCTGSEEALEGDDLAAYNATTEPDSRQVLAALCTDAELRELKLRDVTKGRGDHALTPPCDLSFCSTAVPFVGPTLHLSQPSVAAREYLTFVLARCGGGDVRGKASYTILNPGGEHLGTDIAPLPLVYLALLGGWLVVVALWMVNLCQFRNHHVNLQRMMALVPVTKLAGVGLRAYYFHTGQETGDLPSSVLYFWYLVYVLYKASFTAALLLIAKGWLISRPSLDPREQRGVFWTIFSFCILLLAYIFFPSFQTSYGLLLLCAVYFWIMHTVFQSSARNVQALSVQVAMIRQHGVDPSTTPVPARVRLFARFRGFMIFYVLADLGITVIVGLVLTRMLWVENTAHELVDLLFVVGVGWTFRMREFNPYFYEIPVARPVGGYGGVAAMPVLQGMAVEEEGLQEWQRGQPLPAAPAEMLYPQGSTVVVEGPSTTDEAGNVVEGTVMVGRQQEHVQQDWASAEDADLPGQMQPTKKKKKKKKKSSSAAAYDGGGAPGP